jgi:hypothetical protein
MDSNGFILANLDVSGVNRVHYDSLSYSNIVMQLKTNKDVRKFKKKIFKIHYNSSKAIPSKIRGQIITDAFSFARTRKIPIVQPFELISCLKFELDYLPCF